MMILDFHPTQGFLVGASCVTYSVYLYSAYPIKIESNTSIVNNSNASGRNDTLLSAKHDNEEAVHLITEKLSDKQST